MELHRFGDESLTATVSEAGAELHSLQDAAGSEWLWQAGPEWPRRAPLLFPVVGRLPGDVLRHQGRAHRMTQHGFARDRRFEWLRRDRAGCTLRLRDDEATRAAYPFPFTLDVTWAVADGVLSCTVLVSNPGAGLLPFSLGAHPAFAWPLPGASSAEGHTLSFPGSGLETLAARRLTGGLLNAAETIPLRCGALALLPALFERDAIVLPAFSGRRLHYAAPGGAALKIEWEGYGDLGLWSKPGAAFLCLEPWCGTAAPLGWDGEFMQKPDITHLAPGASRLFRWAVRPLPSPS
ncbi:Galactose mutarotase [Roseomonas rosea]|uniref:Galactose mutarotase n=2 Tax=Muricoccus roseus TaxID=198092 RepID=A0A1M6BZZ4_9PROT|nr:Galactose mutarotase [Roseomonas rosea]